MELSSLPCLEEADNRFGVKNIFAWILVTIFKISQVKRHAVPPPSHHGHPPLGARNSGPWQDGFGSGSVTSRSTHVSPSRVSHVSGAGSRSHSRGSNNEGRSGGSENGAQKAEKGQTKDKFGFHLKENKGLDRE